MSKENPLVLIVDDEADILAVYKKKLEQSGFRVATAADGKQAIDIAVSAQPDLILMDIKMPNLDGISAKRQMSENPQTQHIKVVFLTAFSDPVSKEMYDTLEKSEGAPETIKKGEDLKDFLSQVRGYLGLSQ